MAEKSLTYTVILGDWSDDGHGKTDKYQVEISSDGELTEELIKTNYQANVGKLGFGLPELWEDYEKSYLNQQQLYAIQKHLKAVYYIFDEQDPSLMSNPFRYRSSPGPRR